MRRTALPPSVLLLLLSGCDCGSPPPGSDAGTEVDAPAEDGFVAPDAWVAPCEPRDPFATGDRNGSATPLTVPAGQSRAGRLTEAMLPADPTGLAVWQPGDFVLASSSGVAMIIEDVGVSDLYDRYGGRPVGIARLDAGRLVDAGDFNEILLGVSTFHILTETVTVMNDGSDGNAAVVRVTGPFGAIDFAGDLLNLFAGSTNLRGWRGMLEYRLEPGSDHVDISVTLDNPNPRSVVAQYVLQGIFQASRMQLFAPGQGFGSDMGGPAPYVGFADDQDRMSWALVPPTGRMLTQLASISGVTVTSMGSQRIEACERLAMPYASIALGMGISGARAAAVGRMGGDTRTITGTVVESGGAPAADVRVHALDGTEPVTRTRTRADGTFSLEVDAARAVNLVAFRRGQPLTAPLAVPATQGTATITMPAFGRLEVNATSMAGTGLPVRVQVAPASGPPPAIPAALGERAPVSGRTRVDFTANGQANLLLAPGSYNVTVSRGYEFNLHQQRVTIAAGGSVEINPVMQQVVPTVGWMCGDYHIHTTRSPDADDSGDEKVLALAADGLEIALRSEHEFAADFAPNVRNLGLEDFVFGMAGEEMTTFTWGHFNVFPMTVDDTRRNGHIPNVYGVLPPAAFAEIRARPERSQIIINHPRQAALGFGYFSVAGYDAMTGAVARRDHWDENFSLVEVFNDSDFEFNRGSTVQDWFSFLNGGRRVFAVGSSDSHHVMTSPVGYPRTCLRVGTDNPRMLNQDHVRDVTAAGHSYVSGGIYLDVQGPGGRGPGDVATGVGAEAMVRVRVLAAEWIDADSLEIIVDGRTTETLPLPPPGADPVVRLDTMIRVPVATGGSWVVFHAKGDEDMAVIHPGRAPFAVSNPLFLQR